MAIVKLSPTSPGQRFAVKVVNKQLHKGKPCSALVEKKSKSGGRNNQGRITTRHIGGGHKKHYRKVDFKRNAFDGVSAKVERLEYDPNRSAHIALILYSNGRRDYIIAPKNLKANDVVESGPQSSIKVGNCLPLTNIPVGTTVCCIELQPGGGAKLMRSAGTSAQLVAREGMYATIRLKSGEMRKVHSDCRAVIGEVSNQEHSLRTLGKAGAKRHRGIRPTVRGSAMNPVDHPHGGGEGRTTGGRHPVTPWGRPTKGYKTRKNKRTNKFIVRSRNKDKK